MQPVLNLSGRVLCPERQTAGNSMRTRSAADVLRQPKIYDWLLIRTLTCGNWWSWGDLNP